MVFFVYRYSNNKVLLFISNVFFLGISIVSFLGINKLLLFNRIMENNFPYTSLTTVNYYVLTNNNKYTDNNIKGDVAVLNSMNSKDFALSIFPFNKTNFLTYDNLSYLIDDFNNNNFSFILLDEITYNIINKLYDINYKIVYKYDYQYYSKNNYTKKDKYKIYIRGLDQDGLSIYNRLLSIDFDNKKMILVKIPSDLYIELPKYNYQKDKLSNLVVYDDVFIKTINNYFSIDIDYMITIDLDYLEKNISKNKDFKYCTGDIIEYDTFSKKGECFNPSKKDILNVFYSKNDSIDELYLIKSYYNYIIKNNINIFDDKFEFFINVFDTNISKDFIVRNYKKLFHKEWDIKELSINSFAGHDKILLSDYRDWVGYPDYSSLSEVEKYLR